jgi:hypothetical protein
MKNFPFSELLGFQNFGQEIVYLYFIIHFNVILQYMPGDILQFRLSD